MLDVSLAVVVADFVVVGRYPPPPPPPDEAEYLSVAVRLLYCSKVKMITH